MGADGRMIRMDNYYIERLNSASLFRVYDTQLNRISQYLQAEIEFVRNRLTGKETILELGAGYGRIMKALAPFCRCITGIDISEQSVALAKEYLSGYDNCEMICMDAHSIELDVKYDVVLCLQNGLSALKGGEAANIVAQAVRLLNNGGTAYFSSYSAKFWHHRLEWFKEQAEKGLIGEIDPDKTKDGNIVCQDGFTARTITEEEFASLGRATGFDYSVIEHDDSILFLVVRNRHAKESG